MIISSIYQSLYRKQNNIKTMKLEKIKLDKSLNKAYFKQSLKRKDIDLFKKNFKQLFERIYDRNIWSYK